MIDYIIENGMALGIIDKTTIADYSPYTNSSNYYSHQMCCHDMGLKVLWKLLPVLGVA